MRKCILIFVLMSLCGIIAGPAQAAEPTTGLCDSIPETYVSTNGMVQVRYNVKAVTLTDMDGKTRTAYSYDYKDIPKLDQAELDKSLSVEVVASLKDKPLELGKEKIIGYSGPNKEAYEEIFNSKRAMEAAPGK